VTACLVLGGAGFLGSTLVRELLKLDAAVTVFDLPGREPSRPFGQDVRRLSGDMTSAEDVRRAVDGQDCVFHFAWPSTPATSLDNPGREASHGLQPSLSILEACLSRGARKVIFPSSGTVYGPWRGTPFRESDPTEPRTPYAEAKLKVEEYLRLYESKGLAYAVLRPGSTYGPGQNPLAGLGAPTVFLHRCLTGQPLRIYGRGEVVRDFTFGRDIVRCAVQVLSLPGSQVVNVSTQTGTSLLALAEKCFRLTGRTVPVEFVPPRVSDLNSMVMDNSREQDILGVRATPLEEGLELTLRWLRSRPAG